MGRQRNKLASGREEALYISVFFTAFSCALEAGGGNLIELCTLHNCTCRRNELGMRPTSDQSQCIPGPFGKHRAGVRESP